MGRLVKNLEGQRFGNLVVISRFGTGGAGKQAEWLCRCDCGRDHKALGQTLRRGNATRCAVCVANNVRPGQLPTIQVDLWFWEFGLKGGFATARDMETGELITHSHNSRAPLETVDHELYPQMRNIAIRLADMGKIPKRNPRHTYKRWYQDARLKIVPHRGADHDKMVAVWEECLASGLGPKPDDTVDYGSEERRHTSTGSVMVDGMQIPR